MRRRTNALLAGMTLQNIARASYETGRLPHEEGFESGHQQGKSPVQFTLDSHCDKVSFERAINISADVQLALAYIRSADRFLVGSEPFTRGFNEKCSGKDPNVAPTSGL